MDNRKIIIIRVVFVVCSCFVLESCDYMRGINSRVDNDSVSISKAQRDSILQSRDFFAGLSKDMQEELYGILWEMDEIAGVTFELERQRETEGCIEEKVAVRIQKRIAFVQEQIKNAEQQAGNSAQLRTMLRQLRSSLLEKDEELERLKMKLEIKKSTLQKKYDELALTKSNLENKITDLNIELVSLERTESALHESKSTAWSKAGDKLKESLNFIKITKKRGKGKEVREAKIKIAERAVDCLEKARNMGDASAEGKIEELHSIIQQLRYGEIN